MQEPEIAAATRAAKPGWADASERCARPRPPVVGGLFRVFLLLTLLIYGLALYQLWRETLHDTREMLVHVNSMLVQSVRATLTVNELVLRGLGSELVARGALDDPGVGRALIERMQSVSPAMADFALARNDGELILIGQGNARGPLPNLLALRETRESFQKSLLTGRLTLGQPYFMPQPGHWVLPLMVPIRDPQGRVVAVMTAVNDIEGGTTAWANLTRPSAVSFRLLRDDGYLMYASPPPVQAGVPNSLYGEPLPEAFLRLVAAHPQQPGFQATHLPEAAAPVIGQAGYHYLASDRIVEYGLWSGAFVPRSAVQAAWGDRLLAPTALLALLLLVATLAYRRAARQQAAADAELRFIANHDSLTHLANRSLLHEEIQRHTAGPDARPLVLMLLDLNRFKEINDTLGHHAGDVLLCQIGPRLRAGLADREAFIARLGGDEFTVVLPGVGERDEALAIARRVLGALLRPYHVEGMYLEIGAALGIAFHPRDGEDSHALLRAADVAMYVAKRRGSGIEVYDRNLDVHTPERLALMAELSSAIENGQMIVHYQPKLDLASGQVRGFEALVRWQHPQAGLLSPDQFIYLAEISEVIQRLTESVLRQALTQLREWKQRFARPMSVAVNLSVRNLVDERFPDTLSELMRTCGTEPGELELEVTETALMVDPERAAVVLKEIAGLGVKIAIDGFGNGYSSLGYLHRLPISELKIDRLFVTGMTRNEQGAAIVRSTIGLAHNLDFKVVAEGVEDEPTLSMLRAMGCDAIQGFLFSRPKAWNEIEAWLREAVLPAVPASA